MEKRILGQCPLCGGNVIKTSKGYKCENNISEPTKCNFFINSIIGNRRMAEHEISQLLSDKEIMLDGFISRENKSFSTVLHLTPDGKISMDALVAKCPHCGGDIRVNSRGFGCSNYHHPDNPCAFTVWRNIGGHDISLQEIKEICCLGATSEPVELFLDDGSIYLKKLGLDQDKLKIIKI